MTPYYHAGLSQPSLFFKKTLFMLSIFARPRPLNRSVLGCHMIVTRRNLEFCNLIGAFTFQYAAILLDQEILRKSPDPVPGCEGSGNETTPLMTRARTAPRAWAVPSLDPRPSPNNIRVTFEPCAELRSLEDFHHVMRGTVTSQVNYK